MRHHHLLELTIITPKYSKILKATIKFVYLKKKKHTPNAVNPNSKTKKLTKSHKNM